MDMDNSVQMVPIVVDSSTSSDESISSDDSSQVLVVAVKAAPVAAGGVAGRQQRHSQLPFSVKRPNSNVSHDPLPPGEADSMYSTHAGGKKPAVLNNLPNLPQQQAQLGMASVRSHQKAETSSSNNGPHSRADSGLSMRTAADRSAASNQSQKAPLHAKHPKIKLPNAVEEVTEVILPEGFFKSQNSHSFKESLEDQSMKNPATGGDKDDAMARLAEHIRKAGGEEESGIFKVSLSKNSSWRNRVRKVLRSSVDVQPHDFGSLSSSSSMSSLSDHTEHVSRTNSHLQLHLIHNVKSVAKDVYVDKRYIKHRAEKGELVDDRVAARNVFSGLEKSRFRDYRILPIDQHVVRVLGLDSKDGRKHDLDKDSYDEQVSSRGRVRRNVERLVNVETPKKRRRHCQEPSEQIKRTSVRVGRRYQAKVPGCPLTLTELREGDIELPIIDQLWDPQLADAAEARGEKIDAFLAQQEDGKSMFLLMEALHRSEYCVEKAGEIFISLYRRTKEATCKLNLAELFEEVSMLENGNKDFYAIAKKLNRSLSSILVSYYRWKGQNAEGSYNRCKKRWNNESDWCHVCQDGGQMIVCEHCHKAYHLYCLNPPLKRVPKGDWYCAGCMKSPAKLNRAASFARHTVSESESSPKKILSSAKKALPFNRVKG